MFRTGFSQCRYCVYCEAEGIDYKRLRESVWITKGKCHWSQGSSSSNLSYDDLRKFHRCPGFVEMLFNFKGYAIDPEEVKRIKASRWGLFVTWAGWIVAVFIAIFLKR